MIPLPISRLPVDLFQEAKAKQNIEFFLNLYTVKPVLMTTSEQRPA
jgi:hypothetical protein